jgi:hypothetical protein
MRFGRAVGRLRRGPAFAKATADYWLRRASGMTTLRNETKPTLCCAKDGPPAGVALLQERQTFPAASSKTTGASGDGGTYRSLISFRAVRLMSAESFSTS